MSDRHEKWTPVKPGHVIPAGQPHRVERDDENQIERVTVYVWKTDHTVGKHWPQFVDSSWRPPLDELPEIEVRYVETEFDYVRSGPDDAQAVVWGLPFRAEFDGLKAASTSPDGARQMIQRMLDRRIEAAR